VGEGGVLPKPRGARRAVPPRTGQFSKGVDADETLLLTSFFRSLLGLFAGVFVGILIAGLFRIVFRRDRLGLPSGSLFERGIISAVSPVYVWAFREPLEKDTGLRFSDGLVLLVWLFMSIIYFVTWPLYGKLLLRPHDQRAAGLNNRPSVPPASLSDRGTERIITCRCGTRLLALEGERRVLCGVCGQYIDL